VSVNAVIRIPSRFQGPTGQGQGGWSACQLAQTIDEPVTIRIAAPVPLETDLEVRRHPGRWRLIEPNGDPNKFILEATPWEPAFPSTPPITVEAAAQARNGFVYAKDGHPVPFCFSCGLHEQSMEVHAGAIGDGRVATYWRPPAWAVDASSVVAPGVIWGALDCAAGWYVSADGSGMLAFTVQYAVEIVRPIVPGAHYAIVAWNGDGPPEWQGRKRTAASAAFDEQGNLVAQSKSLWVAARTT
jgi:hypothetical protein